MGDPAARPGVEAKIVTTLSDLVAKYDRDRAARPASAFHFAGAYHRLRVLCGEPHPVQVFVRKYRMNVDDPRGLNPAGRIRDGDADGEAVRAARSLSRYIGGLGGAALRRPHRG